MFKIRLNLRKVATIAICLAGFSVIIVLAQDNTTDQGVVINGVKWATRNVDKPGTFAAKQEDFGMYYQWNRKVAWPVLSSGGIANWDKSFPAGTIWEKINDPSPTGWRVPTREDTQKLFDTDKVSNEWINVNGINGRRFTDKATGNSIFLPAAGSINYLEGTYGGVDEYGTYWNSTPGNSAQAWESAHTLSFSSKHADWKYGFNRRNGYCIRSVADQTARGIKVDSNPEAKQVVVDLSLQGVVIYGAKWATRNVDKPGIFAVKVPVGTRFQPRPNYPDRFYLFFDAGRTCMDRKDKVGTLS